MDNTTHNLFSNNLFTDNDNAFCGEKKKKIKQIHKVISVIVRGGSCVYDPCIFSAAADKTLDETRVFGVSILYSKYM